MKYIAKKVAALIFTLLLISVVTFFAFSVLPGDAAVLKLGTDATPEKVAELQKEMGLDQPIVIQYGRWLKNAVQGDFGESYQYTGNSVRSLIGQRLGVTALLTLFSFVIIVGLSVPLGVFCGKHRGKWSEKIITFLTKVVMAIPPFFLGILLTFFFGLVLKVFTPGDFVLPSENFGKCLFYLIFPALAIALPKVAMVVQMLVSSIWQEQKKDYVRTAYSKGNSQNAVFYRHILKNAMIPIVTFLALIIADILAGSIVVEQVFSVSGLGRLLITAISNRDYPVVQGVLLLLTAIIVIMNSVVDIIYHKIDPRVRV